MHRVFASEPMAGLPQRLIAVNVPDISPADDVFTRLPVRHGVQWVGLTGLPSNAVERFARPVIRLSRYRAALQATQAAGRGSFVVSHLPLMTAAVAHALRLCGRRAPHLGFAFNFTELPVGARRAYLRNAIRRVDQLTVFSEFEKTKYAAHFDVDPDRFVPVLWAQEVPPVATEPVQVFKQPYLCAVGGEGRDFPLLMEVAKRLGPSVSVVVIAWSERFARIAVPDNVTVLTDLSLARTWRIAQDSAGVLVPLLARETCCGQITLVSAKLLGLPIATTHAHATRDYVAGRAGVLQCEPGDVAAFACLGRRLLEDSDALRATAQADAAAEREIHALRHWGEYVDAFIDQRVARSVP